MKKILFFTVLGTALLLLAGCSQPEKADQAAKALIDSYIFQEDTPELETIYGLDDTRIQKENKNDFVTSVKGKLKGISDDRIEGLNQKLKEHLKNTATYRVDVKEENSSVAIIDIHVNGLDFSNEKIQEKADQLVKNLENKITAESSEQEMTSLVNQTSFDVLEYMYLNSPAKRQDSVVVLKLRQNPDDKEKWQIENEAVFFEDLYQAFGL
ncbi:lipoprotein [Listeria floridensis FSL S10-1187]|uniref:Lipoprotein n=1 Tax=Listeria floridensis FSL S10-1187 TaxID=1265817 RepID=A0ABP3B0Q0_9LIST|nr:DUF5105 domain-containing protein [Listeria floridensis]EUJ33483.1 lipoprotein [Listeria floridensis FSL S10-1187]